MILLDEILYHNFEPQKRQIQSIAPKEETYDVSIVMPCLNEELTLPGCIKEALEAAEMIEEAYGYKTEIVIGDNGSTDRSIEIAESMGARVVNVTSKGYGSALIGGVMGAKGRYVVIADSDGSYDFRECVPMIEQLRNGYELCMGSRFKGQIMPGAMPWKNRVIGNPLLTGILNLIYRSGLSDAHCGIRSFTKAAFEKMKLTSPGMEFASEMVIKATLLDLRRTETPVTLRPDGRDRPPHLRPFRDGWRHLRYIFMLSPSWVFFLPSLAMFALSLAVFGRIAIGSIFEAIPAAPVTTAGVVFAAMMLVVGHQGLLLGLAAILDGVHTGYRKMGNLLENITHKLTLENMLSLGLVYGIGAIAATGVWIWATTDQLLLTPLESTSLIVAAVTLFILAIQNVFGGFLLSIIAGNSASIYEKKEETKPVSPLTFSQETYDTNPPYTSTPAKANVVATTAK
ncbi:MAG: family 2 glycosyl transferase [Anaerolineaceae bacterium]|nr:family 2 glycosyl transferase [Anaerolineaceae bacterium]